MVPLFGLTPRINEFKVYAADGGNALRKDLLLEVLTIHERVLDLSAAVDGEVDATTSYGDICVRSFPGGGCKMDNVFLRLALDRLSLLAMDQAEINARFLAQWRGLEQLLGRLEVDEAAGTVRAANLRFFFLATEFESPRTITALLFRTPDLRQARRVAWENEFLTLLNGTTGFDAATLPWQSERLTLAAVALRVEPVACLQPHKVHHALPPWQLGSPVDTWAGPVTLTVTSI